MRRGEIRLVDLEPARGAEANKHRPAVIVSNPRELPELEMAEYAAHEGATSQFRAFQRRAITFHSDPFSRDTEIAGQMRLLLECEADAPDFDPQEDPTAQFLGQPGGGPAAS